MTNLILSPPLTESHLKNLNAGSLNEHIPSNELLFLLQKDIDLLRSETLLSSHSSWSV